MPKQKQMYANKADLARIFGISSSTVHRRTEELRQEIGKRYNQYAILDNLVSIAVFADFLKHYKDLADKNLRKCVPLFDMTEAERYIEKRGMKWV